MLTYFLPTRVWCRESHVQYSLNPVRCQRTTVSGWMRINACLHPGQSRRNITQNNRSAVANRGCGCRRLKTVSCCRRARFSNTRSRREQKNRVGKIDRSLSRCSMRLVLLAVRPNRICLQLNQQLPNQIHIPFHGLSASVGVPFTSDIPMLAHQERKWPNVRVCKPPIFMVTPSAIPARRGSAPSGGKKNSPSGWLFDVALWVEGIKQSVSRRSRGFGRRGDHWSLSWVLKLGRTKPVAAETYDRRASA